MPQVGSGRYVETRVVLLKRQKGYGSLCMPLVMIVVTFGANGMCCLFHVSTLESPLGGSNFTVGTCVRLPVLRALA